MAGAASQWLVLNLVFLAVLLFLVGQVNGQTPSTGLYFILNDVVYFPGASVLLSDIGREPDDRSTPGSSLRCVTINVNTGCCRVRDNVNSLPYGGRVGEWLYPDNTIVPIPSDASDFSRRGHHNEIRLTIESGNTAGPPGTYTCIVPEGSTGENVTADITLVSITVDLTPENPAGEAGSTLSFQCTATSSEESAPMFTWMPPDGNAQTITGSSTYSQTYMLRLRESYNNNDITCRVTFETLSVDARTSLSVSVPDTAITIMESTSSPTALRSYTLTCVVGSLPSSLDLKNPSYIWLRNNSEIMSSASPTPLVFTSLPLDTNYAVYQCQYRATSIYVNNNIYLRSSTTHQIILRILPPTMPTVTLSPSSTSIVVSWVQSSMDVVDSYTIKYSRIQDVCFTTVTQNIRNIPGVSYTLSPLEEDSTYEVIVRVINSAGRQDSNAMRTKTYAAAPTGRVQDLIEESKNFTSISISWESLACLKQNGQIRNYIVTYRETEISSAPVSRAVVNSQHFTTNELFPGTAYEFQVAARNDNGTGPSAMIQVSTPEPPAIGLLRGIPYPNNSIITLSDIGEDSNALYCFVSIQGCCRGVDGSASNTEWDFPNGSRVESEGGGSFYRTRGPQLVILHRDSSFIVSGIFQCKIRNVFAYFGIYLQNEGTPVIMSMNYNLTNGIITCTSTNGPATTVTWSRTDPSSYQPSQRIISTTDATYQNTLTITGSDITKYTGSFMCTVSNARGSNAMTIGPYQDVHLTGIQEGQYSIGSSALVTCFSNLTVHNITWRSSTFSDFTVSHPEQHIAILSISDITRDLHSTIYECVVNVNLPNGDVIMRTALFTLNSEETPSGPVQNLSVNSLNDTSVTISWMMPSKTNGILTGYNIVITTVSDSSVIVNETVTSGKELSFLENSVVAGVPYKVSVSAINSKGLGSPSDNIFFTKELTSILSPKNIMISRTSDTTMTVTWTKMSLHEARGFIKNYTVEYYPVSSESRKRQMDGLMSVTVDNDTNTVTINGLDGNLEYEVVVFVSTGAGEGTRGEPISVLIIVTTFTSDGNGEGASESTGGDTTIVVIIVVIILVIVVVIAVAVVVILLIMSKRKRRKEYISTKHETVKFTNTSPAKVPPVKKPKPMKPPKEIEADAELSDEQTYENTVILVKDRLKPVSLEEFGGHVARMHADRDKWFELEYNSIEKSAKVDYKVAVIPENRARNRFGNIYPYDHNRVILNEIPEVEHSDYINASYVNGFGRKKVYIAAQGPMENSVDDFWRMIWEQQSPTIVMLTKVFEGKKKCEEYWPQSTSEPFVPREESPFVIELKSSLPFAEYVIKKMVITKTDSPGSPVHDVTLFHYLGWPDHGVPANAISMINFIRRVRKSHPYSNKDIMVVHCSAGVGRTGTFITLDYMLERIKTEKSINTYQFVSELRKQRVLMVQTVAQYVFIHNALDELLSCGDTEVAAANMRIVIGKLSRPVEAGSKDSGFQRQYDILNKVTSELRSVDFSQSVNAANSDKNRYDDRIPFNHTRVRLRPAAAQGSDYINASFVEGYRQKGAYIATQGPLPHTVNDFWRLIWEQECRCIVMLCKTEENGKEVCHRYWPQGKGSSEDYGKLTVTVTDQKAFSDYVVRKLEISEKQTRMSVTPTGFSITQFQYLRWQEDTVPNSPSAILEIANLVQKVQMSTGNKSILVMCNDGVGRSGTFITIHAQMERMKSEAVIDVFQFIKSVRFQRAGLVANKDQYAFCYQVLADFLDGFDTYANFKEII